MGVVEQGNVSCRHLPFTLKGWVWSGRQQTCSASETLFPCRHVWTETLVHARKCVCLFWGFCSGVDFCSNSRRNMLLDLFDVVKLYKIFVHYDLCPGGDSFSKSLQKCKVFGLLSRRLQLYRNSNWILHIQREKALKTFNSCQNEFITLQQTCTDQYWFILSNYSNLTVCLTFLKSIDVIRKYFSLTLFNGNV